MAEEIHITQTESREDLYRQLEVQVEGLLSVESDQIANMANLAAVLKEYLGFFWVGFYLVKGDELVLGPFQGPIACTRIAKGKGVCGASWAKNEAIIVPDVDQFPGHIACSSASRSEIVVPLEDAEGNVIAVLDVDSDQLNDFSEVDEKHLKSFLQWI